LPINRESECAANKQIGKGPQRPTVKFPPASEKLLPKPHSKEP
jgi:hypothetical protein